MRAVTPPAEMPDSRSMWRTGWQCFEPLDLRRGAEAYSHGQGDHDRVAVLAPKRDFLARIFGPAFPRFSVVTRGAEEQDVYSFSVDPSSGIVAALEKARIAAAGAGVP